MPVLTSMDDSISDEVILDVDAIHRCWERYRAEFHRQMVRAMLQEYLAADPHIDNFASFQDVRRAMEMAQEYLGATPHIDNFSLFEEVTRWMEMRQDHPSMEMIHSVFEKARRRMEIRQDRPSMEMIHSVLEKARRRMEMRQEYLGAAPHIDNFALRLPPPQYGRAPTSLAFIEEVLFPANPCSIKGKAGQALLTTSASFNRIFSFFEPGTNSGLGPRHPQDDIGGISALLGETGVDPELGYPLDDFGGIRDHLLRAERHAYDNQDLLFYQQWKAYIKDLKIVNSGAGDSILIQPVITLLGEAFGGVLAHALSSSLEPSQLKSVVQASILIGVGLTVAGIGLRRFKRRLSDNMMKAGAMGTALAIIVAFADLLPPWLAWSMGAVTSILVATGLAMI